MFDAISKALKIRNRRSLRPRIYTAKRGAQAGSGSIKMGFRYLHRQMRRHGHFAVHANCENLIESLRSWDNSSKTEHHKHLIDALRYGLYKWIRKGSNGVEQTE